MAHGKRAHLGLLALGHEGLDLLDLRLVVLELLLLELEPALVVGVDALVDPELEHRVGLLVDDHLAVAVPILPGEIEPAFVLDEPVLALLVGRAVDPDALVDHVAELARDGGVVPVGRELLQRRAHVLPAPVHLPELVRVHVEDFSDPGDVRIVGHRAHVRVGAHELVRGQNLMTIASSLRVPI